MTVTSWVDAFERFCCVRPDHADLSAHVPHARRPWGVFPWVVGVVPSQSRVVISR